MDERNATMARHWFEQVWNRRRSEFIDEFAAPDCRGHHPDGETAGITAWRKSIYEPMVAALPDIAVTVEEVIADGDRAVVRWRFRATHAGDGYGIPATGRRVEMAGMTWLRIEAGRIVEGWDCWNQDGLLKQLS